AGLILNHDYQVNSHSDADYGEAFIDNHPLSDEIDTLRVDGAYYRLETVEKAEKKEVEIKVSELTGRHRKENHIGVNTCTRDPESNQIIECNAGYAPGRTTYQQDKDVYTAKFEKAYCDNCPLQEQCPVHEQKKYNNTRFT